MNKEIATHHTMISDFKAVLVSHIRHTTFEEFPQVMFFKEGLTEPQFKITIECIKSDFFVDENGVKWERVKE